MHDNGSTAKHRRNESVRIGNDKLSRLRTFARRNRLNLSDAIDVAIETLLRLPTESQQAAIVREADDKPRRKRRSRRPVRA